MATIADRASLARLRPRRETLMWGALLVGAELLLVVWYAILSDSYLLGVGGLWLWVYPFLWINVALWGVVRARPPSAPTRHRRLAAALAVGYFAVLAYAGGLVGGGMAHGTGALAVEWSLPPGWSPTVSYAGSVVTLSLFPYKVVGYAALSYLVYATVLDAAGAAVSGALGLLSCVSCSWPVLFSLTAGAFGSGAAIASAVYEWQYALSLAVFVLTVVLLSWRPFGREG